MTPPKSSRKIGELNGWFSLLFRVQLLLAPIIFAGLLGFGVWTVQTLSSHSTQIAVNERADHQHHTNTDKHMSFESKVATFVLRSEHDRDLNDVSANVTLLRARVTEDMTALKTDIRDLELKVDRLLERSGM